MHPSLILLVPGLDALTYSSIWTGAGMLYLNYLSIYLQWLDVFE